MMDFERRGGATMDMTLLWSHLEKDCGFPEHIIVIVCLGFTQNNIIKLNVKVKFKRNKIKDFFGQS